MKLYGEPLNIKNAFVRTIISLPFMLLEIPIYILNLGFCSYTFPFFETVFNIPMSGVYELMRDESFPAVFISSVGILLINIIILIIFKLLFKIKINFELSTTFLVVVIFLSVLEKFDDSAFISFSRLYLTIEIGYIYALIQLLIFSALIYWADLKYEEKHFRKIVLSSLAAIVFGFIVSRILWLLFVFLN